MYMNMIVYFNPSFHIPHILALQVTTVDKTPVERGAENLFLSDIRTKSKALYLWEQILKKLDFYYLHSLYSHFKFVVTL